MTATATARLRPDVVGCRRRRGCAPPRGAHPTRPAASARVLRRAPARNLKSTAREPPRCPQAVLAAAPRPGSATGVLRPGTRRGAAAEGPPRGRGANHATRGGSTPLFIACQKAHDACARVLLAFENTDANMPRHGTTPLAAAFESRADGCAHVLLRCARADPNIAGADGDTLLSAACQAGLTGRARVLLSSKRTDPNLARRHDGCTPLYVSTTAQPPVYNATLWRNFILRASRAQAARERDLAATIQIELSSILILLTRQVPGVPRRPRVNRTPPARQGRPAQPQQAVRAPPSRPLWCNGANIGLVCLIATMPGTVKFIKS